ncbi:hypothetical protein ACFL0L_04730 [Patescibacteria group bacterium]
MRIQRNYIFTILILIVFLGGVLFTHKPVIGASLVEQLLGKILLQVEQNGEAWYIYPSTQTRFYLGRPTHAFDIMRYRGLGITDADLARVPRAGTDDVGDAELAQRLSGYILLQVEQNGEAWYVYPNDLYRYYLGRPHNAFDIMRNLGLGISDDNIGQITIDNDSMDLIIEENEPESESEQENPDWVWDETPPVFTRFMVDFGLYDSATGLAGDYDFNSSLDKVFGEFGRTVQDGMGGDKVLPSFDMFVSADANLYSPLAAEVVMVTYQELSSDYEVHVKTAENSVWLINFDHITNLDPAIVEGATIESGQLLGNAAPWGSGYLIELMITRDLGSGAVGYCPYDFFTPTLKSTLSSSLNTLMSDWETFKGDTNIYDESAYVKPGCLTDTAPG